MEDTQNTAQLQHSRKNTNRLYQYILALVALVVVASSLFVVLAMKSIPGDTLYSAKTTIIEPFTETLHLSNKSKTVYQVTLLKHRLAEIKQLITQETIRDEQRNVLSSNIDMHTASLESLVGVSIDSAFPKTEILFVLNDFASVAGAIESIGESDPKLQTVGDSAENARGASVSLYKKRALSFVQTEAPTDVYAYIAEQLKTVKEKLSEKEVSQELTRKVDNYLDRVDPAIAKGDLTKVIVSIGEAHRLIAMEAYSGVITDAVVPIETTTTNASTLETVISASTTEIKTEEIITQ